MYTADSVSECDSASDDDEPSMKPTSDEAGKLTEFTEEDSQDPQDPTDSKSKQSKNEKKARKAMQRLHLKEFPGVCVCEGADVVSISLSICIGKSSLFPRPSCL